MEWLAMVPLLFFAAIGTVVVVGPRADTTLTTADTTLITADRY